MSLRGCISALPFYNHGCIMKPRWLCLSRKLKSRRILNEGMELVDVVSLIVDWTPPSVNHYKQPVTFHTPSGPRKSFKLTGEAQAFRDMVAILARRRTVSPPTTRERQLVRYALTCTVYLGEGDRGDGDNFWKCIADSVENAGIIHSDARVRRWHLDVEDCDRDNPRTEIRAERIERRTA